MSALERVARRIGMALERRTVVDSILDGCGVGVEVWCDHGAMIDTDDLRAYLLTQALRVLESLANGAGDLELRLSEDNDGKPCWDIERTNGLPGGAAGAYNQPTAADAIIALAERIEGEGRE
jgi:hypothetical protein